MAVRILQGDCREVLATLPDVSVHCCVTSPPYYGLRNYGMDRQLGLEASPDAFVAEMVAVFHELKRILRDDGTLWLNLGDSYASAGGTGTQGSRGQRFDRRHTQEQLMDRRYFPESSIKPKDLIGIPWMVAFALRADGWYLRSDIIWSKPNPMPESVTDRPTSAHEHVFLLSKSARYFYDAEAIREEATGRTETVKFSKSADLNGKAHSEGYQSDGMKGANRKNVWTIATTPFSEAHFATFPPELAERCIKAGTSEKGCCSACGAPWRQLTTKGEPDMDHRASSGADASGGYSGQSIKDHDAHRVQNASDVKRRILEGMRLKEYVWEASCSCGLKAQSPVPCTVLDPFSGAFTTAMVADRLQRDAIGIELNPEYCAMAERRLHKDAGLFAEISR